MTFVYMAVRCWRLSVSCNTLCLGCCLHDWLQSDWLQLSLKVSILGEVCHDRLEIQQVTSVWNLGIYLNGKTFSGNLHSWIHLWIICSLLNEVFMNVQNASLTSKVKGYCIGFDETWLLHCNSWQLIWLTYLHQLQAISHDVTILIDSTRHDDMGSFYLMTELRCLVEQACPRHLGSVITLTVPWDVSASCGSSVFSISDWSSLPPIVLLLSLLQVFKHC